MHCLNRKPPRVNPFVARDHNGRRAYLGQGWPFYLDESVVEQMSVCAKHRHTYGKFWHPRTSCQYPAHQGRPGRSQKSRYSVNMEMAKSIIQRMYGVLVQVGSEKNRSHGGDSILPYYCSTVCIKRAKQTEADASEDKLYECPETSCTEEFQSQSDLDLHMNMFDHHTIPQLPVKESLYDKLKRDWVDHFQTLTLQGECLTGTAAAETDQSPTTSTSRLQMDGHFTRNAELRDFLKRFGSISYRSLISDKTLVGKKIQRRLVKICELLPQ
ncbi:hypothetical protein OS493_010550 [Desmophyllum pertusum]|uniref:C2H2-type domain-containing protein n=1 Tax=Desmophyllum pertusum TaxID=174260 RepID=A0A9X0A7C2_9CNID|nr:hypothetical protein OS493_010550 [Desmophyllum pertusum]